MTEKEIANLNVIILSVIFFPENTYKVYITP